MKKTSYKHSTFYILPSAFLPGFTLLELMVVIFAISVLVMILVPYFGHVRERGRSASCQNNLSQFGKAMGKYMSDWRNYFIYKGDHYSSVTFSHNPSVIDEELIPGGVHSGEGGVGSSRSHSVYDFIVGYLPETVTIESLNNGKPSVRVCPSVLAELKYANYFDTKAPNFKGYQDYDDPNLGLIVIADFQDYDRSDGGYDADDNVILNPDFRTYAINPHYVQHEGKNIPANVIAFIDWNAKEGWGAGVTYTNWMFNSPDGIIVQGTPKWTNGWWVTEVGFHHEEGANMFANYVAMDGAVRSVTSNQIDYSYFVK
jgi:prepilin-type N-terminal cleavage/methylation domain-containing protein